MPPRTPTGLPVAQFFCKQWTQLDAPFAESFMADLNAALVQQFLDISVAERKIVVQPDRVLDDRHREAARRPHAFKRGQPATKRAQARCSGQERCSDQDGRPFWPKHGGGKAWRRSRRVSLPQPG